jgi:hypothetical protein
MNDVNLNNAGREASRHFRNKRGNKSKTKLMSLQRTVETRTCIGEFNRRYQPRNNLVKDENGDLLADSHNILKRWKNVHNV